MFIYICLFLCEDNLNEDNILEWLLKNLFSNYFLFRRECLTMRVDIMMDKLLFYDVFNFFRLLVN